MDLKTLCPAPDGLLVCRRARCRRGGRRRGRRVLRRPHHHPHHLAGLPQEREEEVRGGGDTQ